VIGYVSYINRRLIDEVATPLILSSILRRDGDKKKIKEDLKPQISAGLCLSQLAAHIKANYLFGSNRNYQSKVMFNESYAIER